MRSENPSEGLRSFGIRYTRACVLSKTPESSKAKINKEVPKVGPKGIFAVIKTGYLV